MFKKNNTETSFNLETSILDGVALNMWWISGCAQ